MNGIRDLFWARTDVLSGASATESAFFFAGARSVVAALWNLNDRFTSEFVERFYRELGHGHAPEEALRLTKLAYVNDAQFGHPFYWSSLVLTGDGTPVLSTGPLGQPLWPKVLAGLLTLAAAVMLLRSIGRG